ncbi:hypothetical protein MTO96_004253 [Rhipicephalus appendiculatus]
MEASRGPSFACVVPDARQVRVRLVGQATTGGAGGLETRGDEFCIGCPCQDTVLATRDGRRNLAVRANAFGDVLKVLAPARNM